MEPEMIPYKLQETISGLGKDWFAGVDNTIRVRGRRHVAQIHVISQALSLVAFQQKYVALTGTKAIANRNSLWTSLHTFYSDSAFWSNALVIRGLS